MPNIPRTIQVKTLHYVTRPGTAFTPSPVDDLLRKIAAAAKTVRERHVPDQDPASVEDGKRCSFIDRMSHPPAKSPGIFFRFCSYLKGHLPTGMDPDFTKTSVDLAEAKLTDIATGAEREPVDAFHVLAWGQIMLIESVRGAGGTTALEQCLTDLVHRYHSATHPAIRLFDAASPEVLAEISRAGGVKEVVLDMSQPHPQSDHRFGSTLKNARQQISGTDLLRVTYKASTDNVLGQEDVLRAYEEMENDDFDNMVILLKNGNKILGRDKMKLRKIVKVRVADGTRQVSESAIAKEMALYLQELREEHDGVAVLTDSGSLAGRT